MRETKVHFPPLAQERSAAELEKDVLALWKERGIFRKTVTERHGAKPFVFFEGPPPRTAVPECTT